MPTRLVRFAILLVLFSAAAQFGRGQDKKDKAGEKAEKRELQFAMARLEAEVVTGEMAVEDLDRFQKQLALWCQFKPITANILTGC